MRKHKPTLRWLEQAWEEFERHGGVAHFESIELAVRRLTELYRLGASYRLAGLEAARDFGVNRRNDVTAQVNATQLKAS